MVSSRDYHYQFSQFDGWSIITEDEGQGRFRKDGSSRDYQFSQFDSWSIITEDEGQGRFRKDGRLRDCQFSQHNSNSGKGEEGKG